MARRRNRVRLDDEAPVAEKGGDYFATGTSLPTIRSGCALLDCVLGGGWALGRVANIVGDKAVGKTLLGIEAAANFARQYPDGRIWYRESEAAFDVEYAGALGLPTDRVDFGPDGIDSAWETVEDIFRDLHQCLTESEKDGTPGLYVIDSLDALTTEAALERAVGEGTYGLEKPKLMSELFSKLKGRVKRTQTSVVFISQIRDKIGFGFGEKHTRSGGKALDFYASQILWLSHLKTLTATRQGVKRPTAVRIKAKCKKNKVGLPFRDCEFTIRFGYGIEDEEASLEWLKEVKRINRLGVSDVDGWLKKTEKLDQADYEAEAAKVRDVVFQAWSEIEQNFLPKRRKYV